jgi:deoxyribonuclease-4
LTAGELGANTFQIFSSSPRMWRASVPDPAKIRLLRQARERFDLYPLAIHVNYLVNLASMDPVIRVKSVDAFRGELERAAAIGAEYLVLHPGSSKGQTAEEGIAAFVLGLRDAAAGLRPDPVTVLLENTAGSGSSLGSRFEELQSIRELARDLTDLPVGFCLDTCHLLAAGYDITTVAGLRNTVKHASETL